MRETMRTAMQASASCQKISHEMSMASVEVRMEEIWTMQVMIMAMERQRVVPMASFWRSLTCMFQSMRTGIVMTVEEGRR